MTNWATASGPLSLLSAEFDSFANFSQLKLLTFSSVWPCVTSALLLYPAAWPWCYLGRSHKRHKTWLPVFFCRVLHFAESLVPFVFAGLRMSKEVFWWVLSGGFFRGSATSLSELSINHKCSFHFSTSPSSSLAFFLCSRQLICGEHLSAQPLKFPHRITKPNRSERVRK